MLETKMTGLFSKFHDCFNQSYLQSVSNGWKVKPHGGTQGANLYLSKKKMVSVNVMKSEDDFWYFP